MLFLVLLWSPVKGSYRDWLVDHTLSGFGIINPVDRCERIPEVGLSAYEILSACEKTTRPLPLPKPLFCWQEVVLCKLLPGALQRFLLKFYFLFKDTSVWVLITGPGPFQRWKAFQVRPAVLPQSECAHLKQVIGCGSFNFRCKARLLGRRKPRRLSIHDEFKAKIKSNQIKPNVHKLILKHLMACKFTPLFM